MLIEFVPTVGGVSLAEAPAFKNAPGGAPANVAVGIARLGGSSAFIGKVNLICFCSLSPLILRTCHRDKKGLTACVCGQETYLKALIHTPKVKSKKESVCLLNTNIQDLHIVG